MDAAEDGSQLRILDFWHAVVEWISRLLVMDWAPHPQEGDKLLYVFDGGTLTADDLAGIRLDPDELAEYSLHPPDEAAALLIPRLDRRVLAAVRARREGRTLYLEHGEEPAS